MRKTTSTRTRRPCAVVVAGALALSGAVATAGPASAAAGFAFERLQGNDRYETSAAIARAFLTANGAPVTHVVLASGESGRSPDALAASFLAGVRSAPVLLTRRDTTPTPVLSALEALRVQGATRITVVGGPLAVADAQIASLRSRGFTVDRVGGGNRFETAAAVTAAGEGPSASNVGIVASGLSTIDALAGGPLAYRGRHPMFLVTRDGIPGATLAAMRAAGITSVYVLGGEAVVGARVTAQLAGAGITVTERLAGGNRSETSVAIARRLIETHGFSSGTFNLASGTKEGIDALGGAALSGEQNRVLLVTNSASSAAPVVAFAAARAGVLNATGRIFGGTTVVTKELEDAIVAAGNFQSLKVAPTDPATLPLADDTSSTVGIAGSDNRSYTVSGLNDALRYRITLVNAANMQGAGAGKAFLSSAIEGSTTEFAVNAGGRVADIVRVNGVPVGVASGTTTAMPVSGNITFEIDGAITGTVLPVVHVDGGQGGTATTGGVSTRLETSATAAGSFATAAETFGVGAATTFVTPASPSQNVATQTAIESVDKASNQFDARGTRFNYDENDSFFIDAPGGGAGMVAASLAEFESALSRGDTFAGEYSASRASSSSFYLFDAGPVAPAPLDPSAGDGVNSNDISITIPIDADVDAVVIQRATVTGGADETASGTTGAYATVATVAVTAADRRAGVLIFVDENLPAGVYRYRAALISDGQQSPYSPDSPSSPNEAATTPVAETTGPIAVDTRLTADRGFGGLLDTGDVFTVQVDEPLAPLPAGATLRITDASDNTASIADLLCGDNASCSVNAAAIPSTPDGPNAGAAAGTVLTVAVTAAPSVVAVGAAPGIVFPAAILNTIGITDAAGNRLNLDGEVSEVTINQEV